MNVSGEAADQVVKMTLNGVEVAAKITGAAAKHLAVLICAILKDQKRTRGKARLNAMLRSGKELKVFAVKQEDLKTFCQEAKRYGVLYCVLKSKNAQDGIVDVMVRGEDASKINRIFERFSMATVDIGTIKSDLERGMEKPEGTDLGEEDSELEQSGASADAQLVEQLLQQPPSREEMQNQNPITGSAEKPSPSEPIFDEDKESAGGSSDLRDAGVEQGKNAEPNTENADAKLVEQLLQGSSSRTKETGLSRGDEGDRPSVRKELSRIRAEQKSPPSKVEKQQKRQQKIPGQKSQKKKGKGRG